MGYHQFTKLSRIMLSLLLVAVTGCGKVTQTSSKPTDTPTFDLKYTAATTSTSDAEYKTASQNYFLNSESPVYTVIYGLGKNGKTQELSWGKALVALNPNAASGNLITAKVTAMRKGDIELDSADYSWAKLSYDPTSKLWTGDLRKIKPGFPMYLVAFFNTKGKAYLTILDGKRASGNATVSLPAITPYDTFIATLILQDFQAQKGVVEATVTPGELKTFFTDDFFTLLNYRLPVSTATKFNPENPSFLYYRDLEKRLLALYGLWKENEMEEGLSLLEKYKKESPNWISIKAQAWWVTQFKDIKDTPSSGAPKKS